MTTQENLDYLQRLFNSLTIDLKEMDSDNPSYGTVWDERADVSRQLAVLKDHIKYHDTII